MTSIVTFLDVQKELTYVDGIGYCSMRGAARLAGLAEGTLISTLSSERSLTSKLAAFLTQQGFQVNAVASFSTNGIPDTALALILEFYAFEAGKYCTQQAKAMYRSFAAVGIRTLIKQVCSPKEKPQMTMLEMAKAYIASEEARLAAEAEVEQQKPLVKLASDYLINDGLTLISKFTKDFAIPGLGSHKLCALLRNKRVLYRENNRNYPYQKFVDDGYFVLKPAAEVWNEWRQEHMTVYQMYLTPQGVQWLTQKLQEWLS